LSWQLPDRSDAATTIALLRGCGPRARNRPGRAGSGAFFRIGLGYACVQDNGGAVGGTVEKCASGPVLLVPRDTSRQWLGFLRAVRCDSNDRYGIAGVRPGEYYALAFAGEGPLQQLDQGQLN